MNIGNSGEGYLVLSRRYGQAILIINKLNGDKIEIQLCGRFPGKPHRIAIKASQDYQIWRREIYEEKLRKGEL